MASKASQDRMKQALRGYKAPQGFQTLRLVDMSGGLNTEVPADLLNDNESPVSLFVDRKLKGIARPALGRTARYNSNFASQGVRGIGSYYKKDGTTRLLAGVGAQIYYDLPRLKQTWATQSDFSQAGTTADPTVSEPAGGGLTLAPMTVAQVNSHFASVQALISYTFGA